MCRCDPIPSSPVCVLTQLLRAAATTVSTLLDTADNSQRLGDKYIDIIFAGEHLQDGVIIDTVTLNRRMDW